MPTRDPNSNGPVSRWEREKLVFLLGVACVFVFGVAVSGITDIERRAWVQGIVEVMLSFTGGLAIFLVLRYGSLKGGIETLVSGRPIVQMLQHRSLMALRATARTFQL